MHWVSWRVPWCYATNAVVALVLRPYTIFWSHTSARVSGCSASHGALITLGVHSSSRRVGPTHWGPSLATRVPSIVNVAQLDRDCAIRPSLWPFPQPTNHLMRSTRKAFALPANRQFFFISSWQAVYSAADLPMSLSVQAPMSVNLLD